ncbi:HTTM domain-containing protein [Tenacibaculum sp. 190524A02b]|uniref:HTTM domain-containing protein n=1 Tax=Tenacibaculum vairaonense TaxID=3137860 RepID=A0ABP1F8N7_9FLAO
MKAEKRTLNGLILKLSAENSFSFYSSFLRIFVCLYLAKDIFLTNQLKGALIEGKNFGQAAWLELFGIPTNFVIENFSVFSITYLFFIVLFFFGVGKNIVAFILFIFLDVMQALNSITLNGGDNYLKFILMYLIFINSYEFFSIKKQRFNSTEKQELSNLLSNLASYSICIHLCLIYFVSAMHKIHADLWFNGVATYYTFLSERFGGENAINQWLAKNGFVVTITTYGTILVELFYPVLVWFKETKLIFIFSAIALHLGIAFLMMLYDFQFLFIVVQGMFISNKFWLSLVEKAKSKPFIQKIFFANKKEELIS